MYEKKYFYSCSPDFVTQKYVFLSDEVRRQHPQLQHIVLKLGKPKTI